MAAEKETLSDLQMCMYIVVISHQLNEFVGNTCHVTNIPYPGWHSPFSWHCWLQHAFTKFKVRTIMWKFVCGSSISLRHTWLMYVYNLFSWTK